MSTRRLSQLKRQMRRLGVTQDQVAEEVGVTRTHVCHVLAGRFRSRKVVEAARRLVDERTPVEAGA